MQGRQVIALPDISAAKEKWGMILSLLTPQDSYYQKAQQKLAQYVGLCRGTYSIQYSRRELDPILETEGGSISGLWSLDEKMQLALHKNLLPLRRTMDDKTYTLFLSADRKSANLERDTVITKMSCKLYSPLREE